MKAGRNFRPAFYCGEARGRGVREMCVGAVGLIALD
jgi:hypothetical protein